MDGPVNSAGSALFTLNEPRPLSSRQKIWWLVCVAAYLAVTAAAHLRSGQELTPRLWFPLTQAWVLTAMSGVISFLLFWQAKASGSRGFLWLGGTFLYLAILLLSYPLFFPGAIREEGPLLGDLQSAITVFYLWHYSVVVGGLAATLVLHRDQSRHKPLAAHAVATSVVVGCLVALVSVAWVSLGEPYLATLDTEEGITDLAVGLDYGLLAASLIAAAVAARFLLTGSFIQRWTFVLLLLAVGEAVVNLTVNRWEFGWYFNRAFGMVALGCLLVVLAWRIAILGQVTNLAAAYDPVTAARSRAGLMAVLARLVQRPLGSQPFAVLWIDLDNFKQINDEYGHNAGDQVLNVVGSRVQECIRGHDLLGRLGGDEFVVVLLDADAADLVARRIIDSVDRPIRLTSEAQASVSCSVGIACWPDNGQTVEELLDAADSAMYRSKAIGGNTVTKVENA